MVGGVIGDNGVNGGGEDLVDSDPFLTTALHISGIHLLCYGLALFLSDRSQSLSFEKVDTGALGAEVGLQANKEEGCVWAEMKDLRVPLEELARVLCEDVRALPCP